MGPPFPNGRFRRSRNICPKICESRANETDMNCHRSNRVRQHVRSSLLSTRTQEVPPCWKPRSVRTASLSDLPQSAAQSAAVM